MSIKGNIVKGWITSVIGTLLMLGGLGLWLFGAVKIWPDATIAIALGCTLLMAPKTIEHKVSELIKAWGGSSNSTSNPNVEPNPEEEEKHG